MNDSIEQKSLDKYNKVKGKHPNHIVIVKSKQFCYIYGKDAIVAANVLGTLLKMFKDNKGDFWAATKFPINALSLNQTKLLRASHALAIVPENVAKVTIENEFKPDTSTPKNDKNMPKVNLKQASARIKEIAATNGITYKEAQTRYWADYKNNIGYKVAKLRKRKETEAQKAARAQERQSKSAFKKQCHSISGTTDDGLKIKIQLTQPVKRRTKQTSKTGGTQPGSAKY